MTLSPVTHYTLNPRIMTLRPLDTLSRPTHYSQGIYLTTGTLWAYTIPGTTQDTILRMILYHDPAETYCYQSTPSAIRILRITDILERH